MRRSFERHGIMLTPTAKTGCSNAQTLSLRAPCLGLIAAFSPQFFNSRCTVPKDVRISLAFLVLSFILCSFPSSSPHALCSVPSLLIFSRQHFCFLDSFLPFSNRAIPLHHLLSKPQNDNAFIHCAIPKTGPVRAQ